MSAGQALRRKTDSAPRSLVRRSGQYGDMVVSKGWGTFERQFDVAYKAWCKRRGLNPWAM